MALGRPFVLVWLFSPHARYTMPSTSSSSVTTRWTLIDYHLVLLIPLSVLTHLYFAPFTKVEESFNIQALHDWLFHGVFNLDQWDHVQFPGAVPRSFIPSLILAVGSYPILLLAKVLGWTVDSSDVQFVVRGVLGLTWSIGTIFFVERMSKGTSKYISSSPAVIRRTLILFTATQFHLPFWSSRTTPNGLAFPGVLISLGLILPRGLSNERKHITGVSLLTFLTVVYRLELVFLLGACGLYLIHSRFTSYRTEFDPHPVESVAKLAGTVQATATLSAAATVLLDTHMWQVQDTWIIPEVEAIKFNVLEGKSSEWGTSPWHYYMSSSIPKMVIGVVPFAAIGCILALHSIVVSRRKFAPRKSIPRTTRYNDVKLAAEQKDTVPTFALLFLPLVHITALSQLAHKEWRFISYVVPVLNLLAATAVGQIWSGSVSSSVKRFALWASLLITITLNVMSSIVSLTASHLNYPGGQALKDLQDEQQHISDAVPIHVHISTLPAMTGVTLFQSKYLPGRRDDSFGLPNLPSVLPPTTHSPPTWIYNKTEGLALDDASVWSQYTHLLSEDVECEVPTGRGPGQGLFKPIMRAKREFDGIAVAMSSSRNIAKEKQPAVGEKVLFRIPLLASVSVTNNVDGQPQVHVDVDALVIRRRVTLTWKTRAVVGVCGRR